MSVLKNLNFNPSLYQNFYLFVKQLAQFIMHKYHFLMRFSTSQLNTSNISINDLYLQRHCGDVIMGAIASQITSLTIVYSTVYSDADQRKHQSSTSLAFMWGIHLGPNNSPHKCPVTRKMFPFDDVIMVLPNVAFCQSSIILFDNFCQHV